MTLPGTITSGVDGALKQGPRFPQPVFHIEITLKAVRVALGELAHADQTGVAVLMVAVPERATLGLFSQVAEAIGHELDAGGGVGDEDEVEVGRIRAEELERFGPHAVDHVSGALGGGVGAVRISVQIRCHLVGEGVDETAGVYGGSAVVEIDTWTV